MCVGVYICIYIHTHIHIQRAWNVSERLACEHMFLHMYVHVWQARMYTCMYFPPTIVLLEGFLFSGRFTPYVFSDLVRRDSR